METVERQYLRLLPSLEVVLDAGVRELKALVEDEGVSLASPIEGRIKSWPSLEGKARRKGAALSRLADVSDLVGFRIVVLFDHDVDRASVAAERLFVFEDRERTQGRLVPDQFGYASLHYRMRADWDWLAKLGLPSSLQVPIEVQVRTMAQHVWAAASHALQYKNEESIPQEVRRSVNRLAALTELIDLELTRIEAQRSDYQRRSSEIPDGEELNVDSLKAVLNAVWPAEHQIEDEPYHAVLSSVPRYGIRTPRDLGEVLLRQRQGVLDHARRYAERYRRDLAREQVSGNELVVRRPSRTSHSKFDERTLERLGRGVFYSHTGLTFTALMREFKDPTHDSRYLA
jgi:putative GTP pyrophosphokinase